MARAGQLVRDTPFLLWLSPRRVSLAGMALYSLVFLVAPVRVSISFSAEAVFYLVFSLGMFFLGCTIDGFLPERPLASSAQLTANYRSLHILICGTAIIGISSRFIDRFVVRGVSLQQDVLERREAMELAGSNFFSVVAAFLVPFCFLALFCYFIRAHRGPVSRTARAVSVVLFFLPMADAISLGSRSIILTTFVLFILFLRYFGRMRITVVNVSLLAMTFTALLALSVWIFLQRLAAMGLLAVASVYYSGYAFTLQPAGWIDQALNTGTSDALHLAYFAFLNICQYLLHGLFEFFYMYDHFQGPHTLGADNFGVYFRMFGPITGFDTAATVLAAQPRPGVYTTFFGPVFSDFGWFGPFFVFFFGLGVQRVWKYVCAGHLGITPLYFYMVLVITLFPIVSMVPNGEGLFIITAFVMFQFLHGFCLRMPT
jgi:hypothetical protein